MLKLLQWFNKKRKYPRIVNRIFDTILSVFFVFLLLIGIYIVYDKLYIYSLSTNNNIIYSSEQMTQELRTEYPNAIAWLYIPETINEPIMQGKDNTEYLNKAPDGNYSLRGSIFLDSRNKKDFSDSYNLFYGHHMDGHQMFGALDYYFDEKYWGNHSDGVLLTKDGIEHPFHLFGITSTDVSTKELFNPTELSVEKVVKKIQEKGFLIYDNLTQNDDLSQKRIFCLSTCQRPDTTLRTCVLGFLK